MAAPTGLVPPPAADPDRHALDQARRSLQAQQRALAWRRLRDNRELIAGVAVVCAILLASALVSLLAGFHVDAIDPSRRLLPPGSAGHWLGTDDFGRDLLTRVAAGTRTSLWLAGLVGLGSALLGLAVGLAAGYFRALDQPLMRVCDGLMAIPGILLALALVAALGPSTVNLVAALLVVFTPRVARVVRSRVLSVREETFIEACRAQGASSARILLLHVAPNVVPVLIVQMTVLFADAVLTEAALSFLGAGVAPPGASLGNIIYDGKQVIFSTPWMVVIPSAVLVATVIGLNLVGDGLENLVNPQVAVRPPPENRPLYRLIATLRHAFRRP